MKKFFVAISAMILLASCGANQTTETNTGTTETKTTQVAKVEDKATIGRTEDGAVTYGTGPARFQIFADFECPACQQSDISVTPILEQLAEEGKITLEYRQFPLTRIHPNAFADANAALCAADQNVYRSYKHALYDVERKKSTVTNADYIAIAESLGVANDAFKSCIENREKSAQVNADMELGTKNGITGTPSYMMDGKPFLMAGFKTIEDIQKFIEEYVSQKYTTAAVQTEVEITDDLDVNGGGVVEIAPEDATTIATGTTAQ